MASIFLSYARADVRAASALAATLQKEGHEVWWDRQLEGGTEYSQTIESRLAAADVVIVLWSARSAASPWVRDEAAAGRDRGRLVPASLDGSDPPLGFRQLHTVDLSRWKPASRRVPPDVRRAIEAKLDQPGAPPNAPASEARRTSGRKPIALALAALVIVAVAATAWLLWGTRAGAGSERPVVAVLPFQDLSPGRDQAHVAEGFAEEILSLLSGDPNLRVIGRSSAWQLRDEGGTPRALHDALGATHLIEGSLRSSGNRVRISARLVDARSGEQLWAQDYERAMADLFAIQEEIGASVVERMRGTFRAQAVSPQLRSIRTAPEVYELYLAAKAATRRASFDSAIEARRLLQQALLRDPDYAPAHALMVFTSIMLQETRPTGVERMPPRERSQVLAHARRAVELAPELSEAYVALGWATENSVEKQRAFARAIALDAGNFQAWQALGGAQQRRCQIRAAAASFERAVAIEPLMVVPHISLVDAYVDLGRKADAVDTVGRFSSASRIPTDESILRVSLHHRLGEPAQAAQAALRALRPPPGPPRLRNLAASSLHALGRTDEAVAMLPSQEQEIIGSYWRRSYDRAAAVAVRAGPDLLDRPFVTAAGIRAMIHAGRLQALDELLSAGPGGWNGFVAGQQCQLHRVGPSLVKALRRMGRPDDAGKLLDQTLAEHRMRVRNGFNGIDGLVVEAALFALSGRRADALDRLEAAVERGWANNGEPFEIGLADPAFDGLRADPRFGALPAAIGSRLARNRTG